MNAATPATGRAVACQRYPGGHVLLRVRVGPMIGPRPGHALRIDGEVWPVLQAAPEQGWVDCLRRAVSPPPANPAARDAHCCRNDPLFWA